MKKLDKDKTMVDKVEETLGEHATKQRTMMTEKLHLPGIATLHNKSAEEIGRTLANVIKSRAGLVSLTFTVGQPLEVTSESDLGIS